MSLGKTFSNEEVVRNILGCLPKNKWGPKVTAIEEAQDLKKLELDDLPVKILTNEIHLKMGKGESSKKGIAHKAIHEDCTSEEEESNDNDEEAFSLIVPYFNKMGLKKRFNQRDSTQKDPLQKEMKNPPKLNFFIKTILMLVLVKDVACQDNCCTNPKDGIKMEIEKEKQQESNDRDLE